MKRIFSIVVVLLTFFSSSELPASQDDEFYSGDYLTSEDRKALDRGRISEGEHIGGGVVGTFLGFGIGHAVQGRFSDDGVTFLVGELASMGGLFLGAADCVGPSGRCARGLALVSISALAFVGFRIWEIVDVWAEPPRLNRQYQRVKDKLGRQGKATSPEVSLFVAPVSHRSGIAGFQLRF